MNNISLRLGSFQLFILITISFFGAQRFLLSDIYAYACILPFFLFILFLINDQKSNAFTFLLISIFLCVDGGGKIYSETSVYVRYIIYISAITYIGYNLKLNIFKSTIFICFVLLLLAQTINSDNEINLLVLRRDIIVLILPIPETIQKFSMA